MKNHTFKLCREKTHWFSGFFFSPNLGNKIKEGWNMIGPGSALKFLIIIGAVFLANVSSALAQTFTTQANGDWNNAATWAGGNIPGFDIGSSQTVIINHVVNYNLSSSLTISGTVRIEPSGGTSAELKMPTGRNTLVETVGRLFIINGKLTQFRFSTGGDSGTSQSGEFINKGYLETLNSIIEIAQNIKNESGGIRKFVNSCILNGENFQISGSASRDTILGTSISIGWHGSGNFDFSDGLIHFQQAKIQLAGTSGNFKLNSGTANGDIDYITLKNHINNTVGGGEIFASSSLIVTPGLNLDAYCVSYDSKYIPNGKFSGTRNSDCSFNLFPCIVCINTASTITTSACNFYTLNDQTYTASGTYKQTLVNAAGCDSIVTLNLTINQSSGGTDVITACDEYTWIDDIKYTSSNNSATFKLINAAGCDSTVTLNLIINQSSSGTDVITACAEYTWIDGIKYTSSNNSATFKLINAAGCDSTVTLNLTINQSSGGTDVITACDEYTWIDGIKYTSSNNTASFKLINAAGCDSIVTLNLTITDHCFIGYIFPTGTECSDYTGGGASNLPGVCYTYKKGKGNSYSVTNATPGVFFYYARITAPATNFTLNVFQSNDGGFKPFEVKAGSSFAYDINCNKIAAGRAGSGGSLILRISGVLVGAEIIIRVHYDVKGIIGSSLNLPPPLVTYNFKALRTDNGSNTMFESSEGTLEVSGNCSGSNFIASEIPGDSESGEVEISEEILVHPNPSNGIYTIEYALNEKCPVIINVYSLSGLNVYSAISEGEKGKNKYSFDLNNVPAGIYLFELNINGKLFKQKIILN
jgi:hypothetical protein